MCRALTAAPVVLLAAALATGPAAASEKSRTDETLRRAGEVIEVAVEAPDGGIPRELLERAECIGVFPDVAKGAFIVGGKYGHGIFTCRDENGVMGAPAFFTIAGGSVGWQFGGQQADMVLLIMNRSGIEHLLKDRFSLGGEASATAGPVGRTAKVATDAQLHAQILSWSRSQGAFLGASLDGAAIRPDKDANARFYGKSVSATDILVHRKVSTPGAAKSFAAVVRKHAGRG